MFLYYSRYILLFVSSVSFSTAFNNTEENRRERTFSLFSVVQFPNDVCTSTSGTYTNGTCITSSECSSRGGTSQGSCAAGFGVCCVYTYSATGSVISQNVSYITNPSYPSTYAPTSTPATLSYTINKCSCDVCRLRLDFEDFQLTTPTTAAARGRCTTDYMTLKTTAHTVTSTATGNVGNYPYMCGTNAGQHAYMDVSCTCTDTATIEFVIGDTTNNLWKIKVTQLSCDDPDVARTEGCFQYFTGETGSFESFGLASSSMICGHNYGICIRPLDGYCCIEYTPTTWDIASFNTRAVAENDGEQVNCIRDVADGIAVDDGTADAPFPGICNGAIACQINYIIIPGAGGEISSAADSSYSYIPPDGLERYCGTILNQNGWLDDAAGPRLAPVTSCQRPFRMFFSTGDCGTNANNQVANPVGISNVANTDGDEGNTGFAFTYRQVPGSC